ncbi:hypothetical protein Tco_0869588 [Tanacetum coccineum]
MAWSGTDLKMAKLFLSLKCFTPSNPLNVIVISYGMDSATTAVAELVFEAETLALAGAMDGSFMMTPFKASALNVEFDFKIDLIVFSLETGYAPANFSSRGKGVLQTKDSSAESYSVAEESVIATKGSIIFT